MVLLVERVAVFGVGRVAVTVLVSPVVLAVLVSLAGLAVPCVGRVVVTVLVSLAGLAGVVERICPDGLT